MIGGDTAYPMMNKWTTMTTTPNIDELKGYAKKLVLLLEDPHPGLYTWNRAVQSILADIHQFNCEAKPDHEG